MKTSSFGLQRMPAGGLPRLPMQAHPLREGRGEHPLRRRTQGVRIGVRDKTVPIVTAEAAVADAVQGDQETPRGQGLERGEEEPLFRTGETDRDPASDEQAEELAAVEKLRDQPMLHALRVQPPGEAAGQVRLLVAEDRHGRRPLLEPRRQSGSRGLERCEIDSVRYRQNGTVRSAGSGNRVGDLLAHADPDRPLREVSVALGAFVDMPDMLDEIDPGILETLEPPQGQVAPVQPGKEEHIGTRGLPVLGRGLVPAGQSRPRSLASASLEGSPVNVTLGAKPGIRRTWRK